MKKLYLFLNILSFCSITAQNFNPKTINLPENVRVEDFSFLKEELKNAQVVMLGENTHYDGNVFEMKTKIIKYLHQEMGYNTIAFESGVYDVWKAQQSINANENVRAAFENSLFTIWAKKNEFKSFIEFYDNNKSNLKLFGFDNQITGKYGEKELFTDLYDYCKQNQLTLDLNKEDLELLFESMDSSGFFDEGDITYPQFKNSFHKLLSAIEQKPKSETNFYWSQIIKSLLTLGEENYKKIRVLSTFNCTLADNIRDKQMADNLLAYIKTHPNEKIICWGANQHFANDMSYVKEPIIDKFIPMGSYIKTALKEKVYSLAAITARDSIYLQEKWEKTPMNNSSFEYYLKSKNVPHIFISSNQKEMKKTMLNRFFSPVTFIPARLDLVYDGYLYFNSIKQSTSIESSENETIVEIPTVSTKKTEESMDIETPKNTKDILIEEVAIAGYSKNYPYKVLKKTIENIKKNYPIKSFNTESYSNLQVQVQDTTYVNVDFIADQYDRGYLGVYRSTIQLKEARWNIKNGYSPESLGNINNLNSNPIMYAQFLNKRKLKKFEFKILNKGTYNNKEVFVIEFSTNRNHFSYTHRGFLSNYSGTLYINTDDYAIVKLIENWEVTEFPEERMLLLSEEYNNKFLKKIFTYETKETNYNVSNNLYYLTYSKDNITGNYFDANNKSYLFTNEFKSFWSNFNDVNPKEITFKQEQNSLKKVSYNQPFWESYKLPE
jgi:erythromycin esterase-like protein